MGRDPSIPPAAGQDNEKRNGRYNKVYEVVFYSVYCMYIAVQKSHAHQEISFRLLYVGLCVHKIHCQSYSAIFSFTCVTLDGKLYTDCNCR